VEIITEHSDIYKTDKYNGPVVDGVMPDMLNPSFWVELYEDSDKIIMTSDEIRQFNERNFKALPFLFDFKVLPRMVEGEEVLKWINGLSTVPASARYDESGNRYQQKDYDKLKENLNKGKIAESMNVAYGFTVKRTQMRTWPSFKKSFPDAASRRIDYFTETAVYAAEPVQIYHISADGHWYFARVYNYRGWIPAGDIALCPAEELEKYLNFSDFLVVKGPKIYIPESQDLRISGLQLDMVVKLRVLSESSEGYVVNFPVCDDNNGLRFVPITIPFSEDVSRGFPDYTVKNVLIQAFRFLGEPYGWGGMNNAGDCSSFIEDVYRSFGIILPRNSNQQEKLEGFVSFAGKGRIERLKILDSLKPGTPLYMPGHAMMYLGRFNGRYYIIHNVTTIYIKDADGALTPAELNQVSVTPLDIYNSEGNEYIMMLTKAVPVE
jgi:hypothetical protein